MTHKELKAIEAELERRGYRKYTHPLTSSESWAWFKNFDKEEDEEGRVISGYQVAFRVWDYTHFPQCHKQYGFDMWTSALGTHSRIDLTSNWEPICDIPTLERMAAEFNAMVRKFVNPEKEERDETAEHRLSRASR